MRKIFGFIGNNRTALRISGIYSLCFICISVIFYRLIPILLNYPTNTYNNKFQWELEHANYTQQYITIIIVSLFTITIWLIWSLRYLRGWRELSNNDTEENLDRINKIQNTCLKFPNYAYIIQSIVPSIVILIIITITTKNITTVTFKLWVVFFSFGTLISILSYIFTKRIFTNILLATYFDENHNHTRFSLSKKIFIQLIPIFIVAILFTSLIGYSRLIKEKGDIIFEAYESRLSKYFDNIPLTSNDEMLLKLKKIELINKQDILFIIHPNGEYTGIDGKILNFSGFFKKYLREYSLNGNGHVYDYYGVDLQGIVKSVNLNNEKWIVGIKYQISSNETLTFFIISFVVLFILNCIVILYFTKTLVDDIARVSQSLGKIAEGKDTTFDEKLALTSNDEIGDLVLAFNNIQKLEKKSIETIKENQTIILEQERLASLGQLIGGIAHNLKTPIMSISGGIEALKDLTYEYRDSIDDKSVTEQDHKDIAKEMLSWLERMKPYCSYMSDVISAVKGQAVQMNASTTVKFTVDELIKRVDLLLKHELKKYHCLLKLDSQIDLSTEIKGEVNNLVQVFDNIIINAMQAYDGQNGSIDLTIVRSGDNVEFTFKDYGKGIPKQIADKLFREMITTKGKNGTGLGLYMSYSTIKGRFGGNMSFTSKEGLGTTFFISIPCITYTSQEAG